MRWMILLAVLSIGSVALGAEICAGATPETRMTINADAAAVVGTNPNRTYVDVCISPETTTTTAQLKCRIGGTAPVFGPAAVGTTIKHGKCRRFRIGSKVLKCIGSVAAVAVEVTECVAVEK
jgi:hypothetical protein